MHNPVRFLDPSGMVMTDGLGNYFGFSNSTNTWVSQGNVTGIYRGPSSAPSYSPLQGDVWQSSTSMGFGIPGLMIIVPIFVPNRNPSPHTFFPAHIQPRASQISGFPSQQDLLNAFRDAASAWGYAARHSMGGQFVQDVIGFPSSVAELYRLILTSAPTRPNAMQREVQRGWAPRDVERVDPAGPYPGARPHVHFRDGTALNDDGTIHDEGGGIPNPTNRVREWLERHGWNPNVRPR